MQPKKQDKGIYVLIAILYAFILLVCAHIANIMYPATETSTKIGISNVSVNSSQTGTTNIVTVIFKAMEEMETAPFSIFPLSGKYIFFVLGATVLFGLLFMYIKAWKQAHANDMPNSSDGSSEWNSSIKSYNKEFTIPYTKEMKKEGLPDPNIILSQNVRLGMDNKKTGRNLNCLVIGGSGTGKSFRIIKPNIMQMNCSTITTDPSGELLECTGKALMENGIKVKLFSTSDMKHSNCYNPFDYVYNELGEIDETKVSTMVFLFLKNANGAKEKSGDPFWEKSAKALISSIVYYLLEGVELNEIRRECVNFTEVLKLVQAGKVNEDSSSSQSQLDKLMEARRKVAREKGIVSKAYDNYATFKLATGKTANSILITCAVDLQLFSNEDVKNLTRTDLEDDNNNLHLDKVGDEQTALFINIPQANGTYNFLVSMMYSQLFDALYTKAEKICAHKWMIKDKYDRPVITMLSSEKEANEVLEMLKTAEIKECKNKRGVVSYRLCSGRKILCERPSLKAVENILKLAPSCYVKKGEAKLPWHVRCLMDEFANIGEVPQFSELLATMRKYEISCTIVLQSLAQLKSKYDKMYEGIIGNCDSMIFLGSTESETCKYISDMLGKATIRVRNTSRSVSGKGGNSSQSYQNKARSLLEMSEVSLVDNTYSIIRVRGEKPFFDEKYNFLNHPNFKMTGDADWKNKIDEESLDKYFKTAPDKKNNKNNMEKEQRRLGKSRASISLSGQSVYTKPENTKEILDITGVETEDEFNRKIQPQKPSKKNLENAQKEPKTKKERLIKASTTSKVYASITGPDGGFLFG